MALDQQLTTLKANYAYYKATIARFYNNDSPSHPAATTKDAILEQIANFSTVEQLDVYVKRVKT